MEAYMIEERYDIKTAASWILGHSRKTGVPVLPENLYGKTAHECTDEELMQIFCAGKEAGLKLYPFKSGTQVLARVRRTLGFLHSVSFGNMLDVGSGRGVFLIPFMKEFPNVNVTSIDILEKRVAFLNELSDGGFPNLHAEQKNICDKPFHDDSFDVVSMLEVLEHIPDADKAINSAIRIARKYIVVTVPSKPDNNPEHIHLLTKNILTDMFRSAGCEKLHFDGVEGHMFMTAVKGD